jgi:hypothetical protein
MLRFIGLFLRYGIAIIVACGVSLVVFGLLARIVFDLQVYGSAFRSCTYVVLSIAGFLGVFLGSLCLEKSSRRFGSVFLFVLGTVFSAYMGFCIRYPDGNCFGDFVPAFGGLIAVVLIFRQFSPKTPIQQINEDKTSN